MVDGKIEPMKQIKVARKVNKRPPVTVDAGEVHTPVLLNKADDKKAKKEKADTLLD